MKTLAAASICLTLCTSPGKSQEKDYSFKEGYAVSLPAKLTVSSSDGSMEVLPSDGKEIEVFYSVRKNNHLLSMTREELAAKGIQVNAVARENSLDITVKYPSEYWSFHFFNRLVVDLKIEVPKETGCNLTSSDGNLSIEGLKSNQRLKTSDGNVRVSGIAGDITAKTSDGNMDIAHIQGSVSAETSDGSIRAKEIDGGVIDVRSSDGNIHMDGIAGTTIRCKTDDGNIELGNLKGDISARTSDGHIIFRNLSGSVEAVSSDGSISGNILELKKSLIVKTSDGDIDVNIPAGLGMDLDVRGSSLDVPLENFSGESAHRKINGKMNGGGIAVNLSTGDGNVKLSHR